MGYNSGRRGYRYHNGYQRSAGTERALQHIREAEELTEELKGTDQDLKQIFFNLDRESLHRVLQDYRNRYGAAAYNYACETLPYWRTGRRKMSGLVAGRIFDFLPRHIGTPDKNRIVQKLWRGYCPKSTFSIVAGKDATAEDVIRLVEARLNAVVKEYQIPSKLQQRFLWLTENNSQAAQELLNKCLLDDKNLAIIDTTQKVPLILRNLQIEEGNSVFVRRTLVIGYHELEMVFSSSETGVRNFADADAIKFRARHLKNSTGATGTAEELPWGWIALVAMVLLVIWIANS